MTKTSAKIVNISMETKFVPSDACPHVLHFGCPNITCQGFTWGDGYLNKRYLGFSLTHTKRAKQALKNFGAKYRKSSTIA